MIARLAWLVAVVVAGVVAILAVPSRAQAPDDPPRLAAAVREPAPPVRRVRPPRLLARHGVREAARYARGRIGVVAFAVAGDGPVRGLRIRRVYPSASLVKAMLAAGVLRAARGRALTPGEEALLTPMLEASDNDAASTVYALDGGAGLRDVARAAGLRDFADTGNWADTAVSASDQARLFQRLDALVPARHRRFLEARLSSVVPWQRWGLITAGEARGFRVYAKGGWRIGISHQAAALERRGDRIAIAVLSEGAPTDAYARTTLSGVARRLLAP